jgi:hypothetical protein
MRLPAVWTIFCFEFARTTALSRISFGALLALFPVALVATIQYLGGPLHFTIPGLVALYALIPGLTCVLAALLWATPVIHAEIEGGTWPYLAVRPCGRSSILLGKYLASVGWTVLVAWLSLTLSILVVAISQQRKMELAPREAAQLQSLLVSQRDSSLNQDQQRQLQRLLREQSSAARRAREDAVLRRDLGPHLELPRAWGVLSILVALSAATYGALFTFFGVLLLRRGMAMAVAYTFLFEGVVSMLPAVVHRLTVQYHLRCLLVKWMSWTDWPQEFVQETGLLFGNEPTWQHIVLPLGLITVLLFAASLVLRRRQLVRTDEA